MASCVTIPESLDDVELPKELPPIVVTAFARSDLLEQVLTAIGQQSLLPPKIIAFVDGARKPEDQPLIKNCVSLLEDFAKIIPVHVVQREHNLGCDQNVILGFTEVFSDYDSIVYLEDDDVPNAYFYDRMCRLLEVYRDCKQVCSVSSYATYPENLNIPENADFIVSNRVFSWGIGLWADRWQEMDLANHSGQYNPFGHFYHVPATSQTKMTIINQFWLEKNLKTDWVITFTLAALYHHKVHIVPVKSFALNIGFGHPESETYKGEEQAWVNAKYDKKFYPNSLPASLELSNQLKQSLSDLEIIQYFWDKGIWLTPLAFLHLFKVSSSLSSKILLLKFFIKRFNRVVQRWRSKLPA
ncbi:MAG: glycosyltransferase family 2 protein [Cyanothece sp. SIO2G6]|nr:glycosyltransferase family 2 protein [Cyanothece sp. SIO2G6]